MISFIWPLMLSSLLLVPLFALFYLRLQRQRRNLATRAGMLGIVQDAARRPLGMRRHIPPILFLTGITILLVSLARPQAVVSLPRLEGTVMLVFDVSGSMAADDLQPTRMEAAKAAARAFVLRQPSTLQIGVIAFSDGALTVQVPTYEQDRVLASIDRLAPQRGTSLGHGILAAIDTIFMPSQEVLAAPLLSNLPPSPTPTLTPMPEGIYTSAAIVLLTDGENTAPPDPLEAALLAADRGVRIHTVGIGSAEGTPLEVEGFTVHTRLDEDLLQQVSQITDGTYTNAMNEEDLLAIYENLDPQLVMKPEEMEVTSIFAGASILVLLIGGTSSLFWLSRFP
jgi:Ca-activated chloride channel family protein